MSIYATHGICMLIYATSGICISTCATGIARSSYASSRLYMSNYATSGTCASSYTTKGICISRSATSVAVQCLFSSRFPKELYEECYGSKRGDGVLKPVTLVHLDPWNPGSQQKEIQLDTSMRKLREHTRNMGILEMQVW